MEIATSWRGGNGILDITRRLREGTVIYKGSRRKERIEEVVLYNHRPREVGEVQRFNIEV